MTPHPQLTGTVTEEIANESGHWPQLGSDVGFANDYLRVTVDTIEDPGGANYSRVVVRPRGAVGVAAVDDDNRILLVQQFRHAVQQYTIEIPAGILDIPGESEEEAIARELAEEADVFADSWERLYTINPTPGFCAEEITLFLARSLHPVPLTERTPREAEEAHMRHWWVPINRAVATVLAGKISDAKTIAAILTVAAR